MSGIGFWEFIFLCMIGLIVLGPKRLPAVANQLGSWVGQARRMTRTLRRQLEDELDLEKELNIRPSIAPPSHPPPRDDDSYSPLHDESSPTAEARIDDASTDDTRTDDEPAATTDDEVEREQ